MPAAIALSEYNSNWPGQFEAEKAFLLGLIGCYNHGTVEHIGSTSVPELVAKPVIDIMFGVRSLEASMPAIELLSNNGYCYYPYKGDVMHWFCKPSDALRTHHLHLIPFQSPLWQQRIKFRDILRSNGDVATAYSALKIELASRYHDDRERYTLEKWPFIKRVLEGKQVDNS